MEGIYLSPVSRFIEIGLAVSGILILIFVARAFLSVHAWGDGAEYEMMDMEKPKPGQNGGAKKSSEVRPGLIGTEDRVVRFGFSIALGYLSITWFGIGSPAMWLVIIPVVYFFITASVGRDPIYERLGLSTKVG